MSPTWEIVLAIAGLALISVITRGFFLIPEREVPIPHWLREALRFAPLAALAAIVVPEIALDAHGAFLHTWRDAKLAGALVAALVFWRTRSLLTMILVGTAVFLPLHVLAGW